jgi:hypothetical protein
MGLVRACESLLTSKQTFPHSRRAQAIKVFDWALQKEIIFLACEGVRKSVFKLHKRPCSKETMNPLHGARHWRDDTGICALLLAAAAEVPPTAGGGDRHAAKRKRGDRESAKRETRLVRARLDPSPNVAHARQTTQPRSSDGNASVWDLVIAWHLRDYASRKTAPAHPDDFVDPWRAGTARTTRDRTDESTLAVETAACLVRIGSTCRVLYERVKAVAVRVDILSFQTQGPQGGRYTIAESAIVVCARRGPAAHGAPCWYRLGVCAEGGIRPCRRVISFRPCGSPLPTSRTCKNDQRT